MSSQGLIFSLGNFFFFFLFGCSVEWLRMSALGVEGGTAALQAYKDG